MTGLKLSEVHDDDVLTPKTGRAGPVYLLRNYRTPIPEWLQGRARWARKSSGRDTQSHGSQEGREGASPRRDLREGFQEITPTEFATFFCSFNKCTVEQS